MSLYGRTDSNENLDKVLDASGVGIVLPQADIYFVDDTEAALAENKQRGITGPGYWSYYTYTDSAGNTRHKAEHLVFICNPDTNANETQSDDAVAADVASAITISAQPTNQSTYTPLGAVLVVLGFAGGGTTIIGEANQTYTAVSHSGGSGTGATFTVTRDGDGDIDTVTIVDAGSGYINADTVTIDGADIGGTTLTDDLTFTIDTVATAAATFSVTASTDVGAPFYQWQTQTATGTRWTNISGATNASLALTGLTTADSGKKYRVKITSTAGAEEVISNTATLTVTAA